VHFGRLLGPAGFARPVAIKRLHAQFARDPDFVKMFFDEARLAARIAHPNVVATLDVVAVDDEVFLVMDYVRGASLAQLIRTVRRRAERVQPLIGAGVVSGMLHGLHAAHEARNDRGERLDLVHRDVSPQNVLVGTDGVPRLLDFGVAKASGRLQTTRDGQLKGKLAYMAPEQVRGDPLSRRTDVYAASVVLWEVLTGKRLFYAENEASVLARVLNAEVPAPSSIVPDLPASFDRVVAKGLDRDPAKRYATAREMAAELEAVIGVASPTEIGEWVELTAADELRERALLISEVERTASEAGDLDQAAAGRGDPSGSGARQRDVTANDWYQTTKQEGSPPLPREASQVSGLSLASEAPPRARASRQRRAVLLAALGTGALLVGVVLITQSRFKRVEPQPPSERQSLEATARLQQGHTGSGQQPAVTVPRSTNVEDLPRAAPPLRSSTAAPPGDAETASNANTANTANKVPPTPVAHAFVTPPAARPSVPVAAPAADLPNDCNPPYTADAKGHIHFKPNCM